MQRSLPQLAAIMLTGMALASCAVSPVVEPPAVAAVPPAAPRITGVNQRAEREHQRLLAAFGGAYQAPAAQRMLDELASRLVPATERPDQHYRVTILDSPMVNAFALPTGNIYVTRGLLALANDASELAGVMAHEMAHVTASHATARDELEKQTDLISRVNVQVLKDPTRDEAFRASAQGTIAGFSREQELEADRIGIRTSARAGYDPYGSARFLEALDRNVRLGRSGSAQSSATASFMATHPSTPQRIALALRSAREVSAPGMGDKGRRAYLEAIDGIRWGEDPQNGDVRGRVFRHPRLGITFTAPEGFALDNSFQALMGVARNGELALRLDAVELPPSEQLDAFLSSGWIDGVSTESTTLTTINGLPAATGVARGKEWVFYLGAIRIDNTVFRLVVATRQRDTAVEQDFQTALGSLRRMTPAEIRAIKPLRIRIVAAAAGDTPETLAQRMIGVSQPLERFRVLNGLRPDEALVPGERYKVISE
ncbi:M48 family metalloprotease [Pseudochelatococcus lubricantis]|uniref:M48 family metalloprotease n=1 Tax=Pseudochelatococcus lubricantis TaxID=1538102 RepID=UPI0035EC4FF3